MVGWWWGVWLWLWMEKGFEKGFGGEPLVRGCVGEGCVGVRVERGQGWGVLLVCPRERVDCCGLVD